MESKKQVRRNGENQQKRPFFYRSITLCNCSFEAYFEREADSPKLLETLKTQSKGWSVWKVRTRLLSQLSYTPTAGTTFILKHFREFQNPFLRFSIIWSELLF
jgi:hypothetical protein